LASHLAREALPSDHHVMGRRRDRATLEDVVEYLRGIATTLMEIDAKLQSIASPNGEDDNGEA
jgi:hypothetical protein